MASNNPGSAHAATPRALATPNRRAISAEPTSGRPSASARRNNNVATPHGRAAIRAMNQRRATLFTPGRVRRRSLREQRETPRDLLRNLSRVLAPTTQPVSSSSSSPGPHARGEDNTTLSILPEDDEADDDFPIERPRFSLPLGPEEDEDDDSDLKPPRLSGLEDENYTAQSIELPRRARSEGPLGRIDRMSMGSVRFSDYAGPEILSEEDVGIDSGFFPPPALEDTGDVVFDEQAMFEHLDTDETRRETVGRESGFPGLELPDARDESTFMMAPIESPTRDLTTIEGLEEQDEPQLDDDSDGNEPLGAPDLDDDSDRDEPMGALEPDDHNEDIDVTIDVSRIAEFTAKKGKRKKAGKKISRHGIEYPSLPTNVVKRLATTFAKTAGTKAKITPDTLTSIMQATDWFFEQLGDDLSAYAKHAGRKTIDESDMITLMRRQRQTSASTTPFALAQRYLPRELLQELRMPVPAPTKAPRKKSRQVEVDGEEDVT
ncbi:Uu.00g119070.m01.CDS01 [Anthostomella pinea]|uniref:Uu.00g119070.m01.CDS01 n=1 Tax=Anthostomella pinea TaxID=933095 RepID=A0AAI8YEN8_9PEZI|nr:Uu.00g119070.m01.CDS01 [Anthostomella pinea]